jgi:hypothetical protein
VPASKHLDTLTAWLERSVLGVAAVAVIFRASLYWHLPKAAGAAYGTGDVVEFGLCLLLFVLSSACAACGVAMSLRGAGAPTGPAYRPVLIGITSFVAYYLLAPQLPQLW